MNNTEKASIYDKLDCCEAREKCPKCGKDIDFKFTTFRALNFSVGPVWQCPHCYCDVAIDKIVLKEV